MIAKVIVDIKAYSVDRMFDYIIPPTMQVKIGTRVAVPFGRQQLSGYVVAISDDSEYAQDKLKEITEVSEIQFLNEELIQLATHFAKETGSFQTSLLQTMLPKDITKRKVKYIDWVIGIAGDKISARAKKQVEAIAFAEGLALPFQLARLRAEYSAAIVQALVKSDALIIETRAADFFDVEVPVRHIEHEEITYTLRDEQLAAIQKIQSSDATVSLIQGVTGSGKTEVYLHLVEEIIQSGKTAMVLVPEIGLTPQMILRFEQRFGYEQIAVLHSRLTATKRFDMWRQIKGQHAKIVLGTRSAIFAPLDNIGMIIIDEEHDGSYKQENMPTYHAKDVAIWRAEHHGAKVVLASATPSLESFVRAERGLYQYIELNHRVNTVAAKVEVVDMRKYIGEIEHRYFSKELLDAMQQAFANNEQVIMLLNRRGYAPIVQCRSCGYLPECPNCDTSLVYHQYGKK